MSFITITTLYSQDFTLSVIYYLRAVSKVTLPSTQSDPRPLRTSVVLLSKHLNNTLNILSHSYFKLT